jgi:aspartate 1-decarboxylase
VIIISYADYEDAELDEFEPLIVHVDSSNRVVDEAMARLDAEISAR